MQQFNDIQRLAFLAALEKVCSAETNPRPRSGVTLRTEIDESLRREYEERGIDRVRIKFPNSEEVGTLSLSFTKPKEGEEMHVDDAREVIEWLRATDEGADVLASVLAGSTGQKAILAACTDYGFLPDGCRMVHVFEPKAIKGTTLRVDPAKVGAALAGELPSAVAGLLGIGEE